MKMMTRRRVKETCVPWLLVRSVRAVLYFCDLVVLVRELLQVLEI